jgi:hypothetical protein
MLINNNANFGLKKHWHTPCYANLNSLSWPAGFGVIAHGVRIGIRTNDPDMIALLKPRIPRHARPIVRENDYDCVLSVISGGPSGAQRVRKYNLLYHNHMQVSRMRTLAPVIDEFEMLFPLVEGSLAPRRVFIHAGVVGYLGQAILLPGETHAGKSTLVSELVKAGATYYSDEYAVIDNSGRVHPYSRPISLRGENGSKIHCSAEAFGGAVGKTPLPIGMVAFTNYRPGAKWRPQNVSAGKAFLGLLANCVCARTAPLRTVARIQQLAAESIRIKTDRPEADFAAKNLLQLLEDARKSDLQNRSRFAA